MNKVRRTRVLFVSHSAERNGASILLLNFLQWLRDRVDWEFRILVHGRGPLLSDFQSLGRTMVWRDGYRLGRITPDRWREGVLRLFGAAYCGALTGGETFDLIYANTAATWRQVTALADRAPAILWHIHELEYGLRKSIKAGVETADVFSLGTRFVAVSKAVRDTLVQQFGVPAERLDLVHGFVPVPRFSEEQRHSKRSQVRAKLGFEDDAFVVGACGSMGWRKGSDLFPLIARAVTRNCGDAKARFVWVGGAPSDNESVEFTYDLAQLGIAELCRRIPTTDNVWDLYCAMDVFVLPSREDPFPLVMLEAAACGVPIVCFEGSGGGPEFAGRGCGLTAPYGDVAALAACIMKIWGSEARQRYGEKALYEVEENFSLAAQGPKLLRSIELAIEQGASALAQRACGVVGGRPV